ncbi:hypothetical protein PI125_g17791 [Phytophthora idaei]|nr:hypothetical protein PI125_g17791 [Phytophthora idaei]
MAEEGRMRGDLEESVLRTYEKASQVRPQNTSRAYASKQKEF